MVICNFGSEGEDLQLSVQRLGEKSTAWCADNLKLSVHVKSWLY